MGEKTFPKESSVQGASVVALSASKKGTLLNHGVKSSL